MNQPLFRFFAPALSGLAALVVMASGPALFGQAIEHPNQIRGTIRFTNPPDSPVGRILGSPGNQGFHARLVRAFAVPPFDLPVSTPVTAAGGLLESSYEITVETLNPGNPAAGIAYGVAPRMILDAGHDSYNFRQRTSSPVMSEPNPDVILNFNECVGLVELRFVSTNGSPAPVRGGSVQAIVLPEYETQAGIGGIRDGATIEYLAVKGVSSNNRHSLMLRLVTPRAGGA